LSRLFLLKKNKVTQATKSNLFYKYLLLFDRLIEKKHCLNGKISNN
jgi:hypothetical protein